MNSRIAPFVFRTVYLTALLIASNVCAGLSLSSVFSDHMVLQQGKPVPVWGRAEPGAKVVVTFAGKEKSCAAGKDGKWIIRLDPLKADAHPATLKISEKVAGKTDVKEFTDVLVGEVWFASGQSNMEKPVGLQPGQHPCDNWEADVAGSTNAAIRVFTAKKQPSQKPLEDVPGKWDVAGPETTAHFTAVGYYFACELNRELKVPVGIIHSSYGGMPAEAFTSAEALNADAALAVMARERTKNSVKFGEILKSYRESLMAWEKRNGIELTSPAPEGAGLPEEAKSEVSNEGWKPITLPCSWKSAGMSAGVHWVRREVTIPEGWAGKPLKLSLGTVGDYDEAYFNGVRIGATGHEQPNPARPMRMYAIPAGAVKAGRAVLALRVTSALSSGGVADASRPLVLTDPAGEEISVSGEWLSKTEKTFLEIPESQVSKKPKPPELVGVSARPSALFDGMVHPFVPYALAGWIWYQGESNAARAVEYRKLFPVMIRDWRKQWGDASPFYWCQLANYLAKKNQPGESDWAALRAAQSGALALPKTGQAVLIDIGEEGDIHPTNKKDAAIRLSRIALARTYGKEIEFSGPVAESAKIEGGAIRVRFSHCGEGLVARQLPATYRPRSYQDREMPLIRNSPKSPLEGFAVAGGDGKYFWADAVIDGETVVVSSIDVPKPVAVRYAWADNPTCNLYNRAGFPASPFGTRDWPMSNTISRR